MILVMDEKCMIDGTKLDLVCELGVILHSLRSEGIIDLHDWAEIAKLEDEYTKEFGFGPEKRITFE